MQDHFACVVIYCSAGVARCVVQYINFCIKGFAQAMSLWHSNYVDCHELGGVYALSVINECLLYVRK